MVAHGGAPHLVRVCLASRPAGLQECLGLLLDVRRRCRESQSGPPDRADAAREDSAWALGRPTLGAPWWCRGGVIAGAEDDFFDGSVAPRLRAAFRHRRWDLEVG